MKCPKFLRKLLQLDEPTLEEIDFAIYMTLIELNKSRKVKSE